MVFLGSYKSLSVLMYSNGSLWFRISPYVSLRVLLGLHKSLLACLHVHFWEPVLSSSA